MNQQEHLDPKRLCLTTQVGLKQQKMIDAIKHDGLKTMRERGDQLSDEQHALLLEFHAKARLVNS